MGLAIVVGGTTRTSQVNVKTLEITSSITANASLCDFVAFSSGASWRPRAGNQVSITTTSDGTYHFGGVVIDVYEEAINQSDFRYRVGCRDYTWMLDRRMVAKDYSTQAASAIVADIVTNFSSGFSTGSIQAAPTVTSQHYDYRYPSDIIKELADQIQWHWYVGYSTTRPVNFFPSISDIAPTTAIDFDTNTANYGDLVIHESAAQVKNRIILQGYNSASNVPLARSFAGDSSTRFFLLGYEPVSVAASNITATIDGVGLDILTDVVDASPGSTVGSSSQLYVCFSNLGVRFSTAGLAPSSSQTLALSFNYMYPGGVQHDDAAAQTEMASRTSGDGISMYAANDPKLTNYASGAPDDLALAFGAALTTRYGKPALEGTFTSYLNGWRAGQYFTGISALRMGSFNKTFYVHQVRKRVVSHPSGGSPTWVHEVQISDSSVPL